MLQPEAFYIAKKASLEDGLGHLLTKKSRLGWGRFFAMALIAVAGYLTLNSSILFVIAVIGLLVVFVRLVYWDVHNNRQIEHTRHLTAVNADELKALAGDYLHFADGATYLPHDHFYAHDIDLFGRASLFQFLNRTRSEMGASTLSDWLLHPASQKIILQRQESVKELAALPDWRQTLQAFGREKRVLNETKIRLGKWMQEPALFLDNTFWRVIQYLAPAVVVTIITLNIVGLVSYITRNYTLLAAGILAYVISRKVVPILNQVTKMAEELSVLSDSIRLIEKTTFKADLLVEAHATYRIEKGFASGELKQLKHILARLEYRLNPVVFVPLSILFQWDLQQVMALENWKRRNKQSISNWFETLGTLEAISSLANLHFNNPQWCFPSILPHPFSIKGTELGHPLINASKRVNNYIEISQPGEMMLVTGSNMAGKSTYLRSIGINVVLAMTGTVVCATNFAVSVVQLMTSMRIADNLEENTSTFYAELKKLKTIIEKVNNNEKVFILLDEILRGTNSLDRHTGSDALIKQLIRHKAVAIIATHDTDLAKLKEVYPANMLNYHFDAQVSNNELYFDYRLKEGVCKSLNASILMKKIGIEL